MLYSYHPSASFLWEPRTAWGPHHPHTPPFMHPAWLLLLPTKTPTNWSVGCCRERLGNGEKVKMKEKGHWPKWIRIKSLTEMLTNAGVRQHSGGIYELRPWGLRWGRPAITQRSHPSDLKGSARFGNFSIYFQSFKVLWKAISRAETIFSSLHHSKTERCSSSIHPINLIICDRVCICHIMRQFLVVKTVTDSWFTAKFGFRLHVTVLTRVFQATYEGFAQLTNMMGRKTCIHQSLLWHFELTIWTTIYWSYAKSFNIN